MKKTKEINRMANTIEKEIERMENRHERLKKMNDRTHYKLENNKRLETMVRMILEWKEDFDGLVNRFDSNDCLFLLENTQFGYDYTIDNIYDAYEEEDWYTFMIYYIKDLLFTSIEKDTKRYTDNLYRLWLENV